MNKSQKIICVQNLHRQFGNTGDIKALQSAIDLQKTLILPKCNPNAEDFLSLGRLYEMGKFVKAAETQYKKAMSLFPTHWNLFLTYAVFLQKQDRHHESIPVLEKMLEKNTPHTTPTTTQKAAGFVSLSIAYLESAKLDKMKARKAALQAVKINPDSASAWSQLGHCTDDDKECRTYFEKARKLDPARLERLHPKQETSTKLNIICAIETPIVKTVSCPLPPKTDETFPALSSIKTEKNNNYKKIITILAPLSGDQLSDQKKELHEKQKIVSSLNPHAKTFTPKLFKPASNVPHVSQPEPTSNRYILP